ncbi:MAG: redoxin domain-containing protein [Actinomycetes bacterium]
MPLDSRLARLFAVGAGMATAATLLGACGAAEPAAKPPPPIQTEARSTATSSADSSEAPAAVPEQLDFTAETVDGATFDGSSLAGKDALVYFWAPWCSTCRREAPGVVDTVGSYEELAFVTVGGRSGDPAAMADFVADVGFDNETNVADLSGDIWARFEVTLQPAYAFVDDSGTVEIVSGPLDKDDLGARIDALLAS